MTRMVTPGKAMLMGEYGVLFGGMALVMPTKQSAVCTYYHGPHYEFSSITSSLEFDNHHPLFLAVKQACNQQSITAPWGSYALDTQGFYKGTRKLGFGSSAAAIAALTKMIFFLQKIENADLLLRTALKAHQLFASGFGSGADVATSMVGKPILFKTHDHLPHYEPINLFFTQDLIFIDTGRSQDTKLMVKQVMEFGTHHTLFIDKFQKQATLLCQEVLGAKNTEDVIRAIESFYQLLDLLSARANMNIISDEHRTIHDIAEHYQGTAKPSGSGGGDLALALIPKTHRQDFIKAVDKAGFQLVSAC